MNPLERFDPSKNSEERDDLVMRAPKGHVFYGKAVPLYELAAREGGYSFYAQAGGFGPVTPSSTAQS